MIGFVEAYRLTEVLVIELGAVDGLASSSVASSEVTYDMKHDEKQKKTPAMSGNPSSISLSLFLSFSSRWWW